MNELLKLFENFGNLELGHVIMWIIGGILIYLAIKKDMEPTLLLPLGFGAILVNLPALFEIPVPALQELYNAGIANELFPLLLFIGIGAMIDFGPLLSNPVSLLLGAAAQMGIYVAFVIAILLGFTPQEAASIAIIGGADGPTAIFLTGKLASHLLGPIAVAAYSYMALIPFIQPPIMKELQFLHSVMMLILKLLML